MNLSDYWEKALANTVVVRPRVKPLETFDSTKMPYLLLSESSINMGDTVTRRGELHVEKPSLILPSHSPQFEGFDFDQVTGLHQDLITNFLLVRGVSFPSFKYDNKTGSLDVFEGHLSKAVQHFSDRLARDEDVTTTLLLGPEDCWQFSLLVLIASQVARCAEGDFRKIFNRVWPKKKWF